MVDQVQHTMKYSLQPSPLVGHFPVPQGLSRSNANKYHPGRNQTSLIQRLLRKKNLEAKQYLERPTEQNIGF